MGWYTARVLLRSFVEGRPTTLLEDRLLLVESSSTAEVKKVVLRLLAAEEPYRNADGDLACWRFMEITETHYVGEALSSGARIYSKHLHLAELDDLRRLLLSPAKVDQEDPDG